MIGNTLIVGQVGLTVISVVTCTNISPPEEEHTNNSELLVDLGINRKDVLSVTSQDNGLLSGQEVDSLTVKNSKCTIPCTHRC